MASAVVFALPLGRRPLDNQDEARYGLLAREAVERGHWILPRVRDEVYLNKPPLYFWTVAFFSLPFGAVSDATAPIASVLSALLGLLGVFAIGRRLWDDDTGLAAALMLATSPSYFFMAHQALTDMMLTAWMTWALYFYLASVGEGEGRRALVGFYLCAAGGLAAKGPAALMVVATALPWLLPYLLQREKSYGRAVVMTDYLGWYFRSAVSSRLQAVAAHLLRFLPWGIFLFPAAWWWTRSRDTGRRRLLVWAATLIVLLSLSGEQRARYFLPLWPVLALLVGQFFTRAPARLVAWASSAYLFLMMGTGAFLLWGHLSGPDAVFLPAAPWERGVVAGAIVIGAALGFWRLLRGGDRFAAATCIGAGLGVALAVTAVEYPARFAQAHDYRGVAQRFVARLDPGAPLLSYPDANLAWDFYMRHSVREVRSEAEVKSLLASAPAARLMLRAEEWARLRSVANPSWRVLDEGAVGHRHFVLLGD